MQTEQAYLKLLQQSDSFRVKDGKLTLSLGGKAQLIYEQIAKAELPGTKWLVTAYNNGKQAVTSVEAGSTLTAAFGTDGTVSGSSGVNTFSGPFTSTDGTVKIGPLASTQMAGPENLMTQEAAYLQALRRSTQWAIIQGKLRCATRRGRSRSAQPRRSSRYAVQIPPREACRMAPEALITENRMDATRRALSTPRAAAIAGIVFAALFTTSIVLIRLATPADPLADATWLTSNARSVTLALNLVPFAGIAFLWFIGVIRDRLGGLEDRFFATVFLGSGLLFLALVFAGAALSGGLLASYSANSNALVQSGVFAYSRAVTFNILNVYAMRMAGVFMMSLATIWLRTGLMHRGWAIATYVLALVLLFGLGISLWSILIFPVWVLAVSVYFLVIGLRRPAEAR